MEDPIAQFKYLMHLYDLYQDLQIPAAELLYIFIKLNGKDSWETLVEMFMPYFVEVA